MSDNITLPDFNTPDINLNTVLSQFDERGTLLKWLKKVYERQNEALIDTITLSLSGRNLTVTIAQDEHTKTSNALTLPDLISVTGLQALIEGSTYISFALNEAQSKLIISLDTSKISSEPLLSSPKLFTAGGAYSLKQLITECENDIDLINVTLDHKLNDYASLSDVGKYIYVNGSGELVPNEIPKANTDSLGLVSTGNKATVNANGVLECSAITAADYSTADGKNFISKATLDTQLDNKVTIIAYENREDTTTAIALYGKSNNDINHLYKASVTSTPNTIVFRNASGNITCATPTALSHTATKQYVDNAIAGVGGETKFVHVTVSGTSATLDGETYLTLKAALTAGQNIMLYTGTAAQMNEIYHIEKALDSNEKLRFMHIELSSSNIVFKDIYFNASNNGTITTITK